MQKRWLPLLKKTIMKPALTILFVLFFGLNSWGQSIVNSISEPSFFSKVTVLIILAVIAIYNYIKWLNENKRTDP